MKYSLLQLTQSILSDMSADEVNSIFDTEEALQVANIIKVSYQEMMNRREWPHLKKLGTLSSVSDSQLPTCLKAPESVRRMEWVSYLEDDTYKVLKYLAPRDFLQLTNSRSKMPSAQQVQEHGGMTLYILTDHAPTYWTTFDDEYLTLDSYDSSKENTVQGHNTQCEMLVFPTWKEEDSFIPDLPAAVFPALLAEAKSVAFVTLKGEQNAKAEQQSVRQQQVLSSNGWKLAGGIKYPNYGRKRWKY